MRSLLNFSVVALFAISVSTTGCKKKESGVCYCKYVSGDKKEFNLTSLDRNRAQDSCSKIDRNANAFGGECDLK